MEHIWNYSLEETIKEDCKFFETMINDDAMIDSYMYLNECESSKDSGLYQLILNGHELYFGTLPEINAVVKAMCAIVHHPDRYNVTMRTE